MRTDSVLCIVDAEIRGSTNGGFGEEVAAFAGAEGLNVHDDELGEVADVGEGGEGGAVVNVCGDVCGLESVRVDEVDGGANAVAEGDGRDVADLLCDFQW